MSKRDRAKAVLPDLLLIAGAASVAYGAWLYVPALGFMVGGALAIFAGIKLAGS